MNKNDWESIWNEAFLYLLKLCTMKFGDEQIEKSKQLVDIKSICGDINKLTKSAIVI